MGNPPRPLKRRLRIIKLSSTDWLVINPPHIDPDMAGMGGFDKPILHGLCTYGICAKNIVKGLLGGDVNKLKKLSCRFTSHVFPGETLVINTWKDGSKVIYNATTKERGKVVIFGVADIDSASL